MKFVLGIASLFALSTLVSGGAVIARSSYNGCGEGGEVLASSNIEHNGSTIAFESGSCPHTAKRDIPAIEERQNICTLGNCEYTCKAESSYTIYASDCAVVIKYFEEQSGSYSISANSYHSWSYGSCYIYFVNADTIPYSVCFATLAYDATGTAGNCLGKTNGGICVGSQAAGQKYGIIVGSSDTAY